LKPLSMSNSVAIKKLADVALFMEAINKLTKVVARRKTTGVSDKCKTPQREKVK
jgi:hypothetical protein